jgi:single-stranded DNA-binding protein
MNLVAITGNLGRAPKTGNKGDVAYASFRLAHNTGDHSDWYSVVCFNATAEAAAKLWKGARVNVTGYLRVNTFEGRDRVEIVATFVEPLSKKPEAEAALEAEAQDLATNSADEIAF